MDESKLIDQNILLVKEKDSNELKAVAGIDKNGRLETVEAKAGNASRFLTFDRSNGDELASIMSDFNRRTNNPKDFQLFQVHYGKFEKLKEGLEEVLSRPHNSEGKELLKMYEVNPKDFATKQVAEDLKVLLTQGEDGKLKAIAGEGKDGKLKTVDRSIRFSVLTSYIIRWCGCLLPNVSAYWSVVYSRAEGTKYTFLFLLSRAKASVEYGISFLSDLRNLLSHILTNGVILPSAPSCGSICFRPASCWYANTRWSFTSSSLRIL